MLATETNEWAPETETRRRRLLFVDDEPNFLNGIRRMLRVHRTDWDMVFVNSVDEAVATADESEFDAVISDVNMPLKNGLDATVDILKLDPLAVVLFVSADQTVREKVKDVGAADFIEKPFNLVKLLQTIERLVEEPKARAPAA